MARNFLLSRHSTISVKKKNIIAFAAICVFLWTFQNYKTKEEPEESEDDRLPISIKQPWEREIFKKSLETEQLVDDSIIMIPENYQLELMATPGLIELYERNINNIQIFCPVKDVLGGTRSGWTVCAREQFMKCVVYLITSQEGPSSFLEEIKLRWGCSVYKIIENDCTEETLYRLKEEPVIDIFAIDVDMSEAILLNRMIKLGVTDRIQQLLVTFHSDTEGQRNNKQYRDMLFLQKQLLHEGFRIFHRNRNTPCTHCKAPMRPGCVTLNMMRPDQASPPMTLPSEYYLRNFTSDKLHWMYHRYLRTITTFCKKLSPVGDVGMGAWEVCIDKPYKPNVPCLVYSFGSADDWSFDSEMSKKFGCEVHSFDPRYQNTLDDIKNRKANTSEGVPKREDLIKLMPVRGVRDAVHYHSVAIWNEDTILRRRDGQKWTSFTLETIRKKLRHLQRQLDILRIDIDSAEWEVVPYLINSGILRQVKQLFLELHGSPTDGGDDYRNRLTVLRQLHELGFRSFWAEPDQEDRKQFISPISRVEVTKVYRLSLINIYVL